MNVRSSTSSEKLVMWIKTNAMLYPLVSVVITTKNRRELCIRALKSVFDQTYRNIEIVIIDDSSIEPFFVDIKIPEDIVVLVKRNEKSIGGAAARNYGVKVSSGEYICFLDDDDEYMSTKIEYLLIPLLNNKAFDYAFGSVVCRSRIGKEFVPVRFHRFIGWKINAILFNTIHTNATLIRRECFAVVSFDENLPKFQDTQFHIDLMYLKTGVFVDTLVAVWNQDGRKDQITSNDSSGDLRTRRGIASILFRYKLTPLYKYVVVRIAFSQLRHFSNVKFDKYKLFFLLPFYLLARIVFLRTK